MKQIIEKIRKDCEAHDISLFLVNEETVEINGIACSGVFDAKSRSIRVATKKAKQDWFEILMHEYCHMLQFVSNSKKFCDLSIFDTTITTLLDLWLDHKIELNEGQSLDIILKIIDMEKECEEMVVNLIHSEGLPIDTNRYTQKANAYLLSYLLVRTKRQWTDDQPYTVEEVIAAMPTTFKVDFVTPDPKLLEVIEKHCF